MEIVELLCRIYGALVLLGYPFYMVYCYKKHGFSGRFNDKSSESITYFVGALVLFSAVFLLVSLVSFIIFGAS